jgi:hypothetical protein
MISLPQVDLGVLDSLQGDDRKNFVGNAIYPLIDRALGNNLAPTITGMLLDEEIVNFTELLSNQQYFNTKVNEAHQFMMQQQQQ